MRDDGDLRSVTVATARLRPGVKAGQIIQWLKDDFGLGHGHAMAIVAVLKGKQ